MQILDVNGDRFALLSFMPKLGSSMHHRPTITASVAALPGGATSFEYGYPYLVEECVCWIQLSDGSRCYFHAIVGDATFSTSREGFNVDFEMTEGPWWRFPRAKTTRVEYRRVSGTLVPRP